MSAKDLLSPKEQLRYKIVKTNPKDVLRLLDNWQPDPASLEGLSNNERKKVIKEAFSFVLDTYSNEQLQKLFKLRIQMMLDRRSKEDSLSAAERRLLIKLLNKLPRMQLAVKLTEKKWCSTRDYYDLVRQLNKLHKDD
jgi:hypothetical protein